MLDELTHARKSFAKEIAHSPSGARKLKQTEVVRIVVEMSDGGVYGPKYAVINLVNLVDFEIGYLLQQAEDPAMATEGRSLYALMQTFANLTDRTRRAEKGADKKAESALEISKLTLYLKPMLENNGKLGILFFISGSVHDYGVNITTLWQYKNWLKFTTYDTPNSKKLRQSKLLKLKEQIRKN